MIEIEYNKGKTTHELSIAGHAAYDDEGKDIVCAAVSAIAWTLAGYLNRHGMEYEVDSGDFYCLTERWVDTDVAFELTMIGLAQIEAKYPQCVEITINAAAGC